MRRSFNIPMPYPLITALEASTMLVLRQARRHARVHLRKATQRTQPQWQRRDVHRSSPYLPPRCGSQSSSHVAMAPLKLHRVPNIMRRVMRCHDFRSGREASRSPYREYGQGSRQSHGRKLVPALRVRAKIARAPQRGAGAAWGCDRTGAKPVPRIRRAIRPAAGSHPSMKRSEPAPPCAGPTILAVTHTCLIMLGTLTRQSDRKQVLRELSIRCRSHLRHV